MALNLKQEFVPEFESTPKAENVVQWNNHVVTRRTTNRIIKKKSLVIERNDDIKQEILRKPKSKSDGICLEGHLFHDISLTDTSSCDTFQFTNLHSQKKENDRKNFNQSDMNCNEFDFLLNHAKRSIFRQRRREWYLKRRTNDHRKEFNSVITKFHYIFSAFFYLTRKILKTLNHYMQMKTAAIYFVYNRTLRTIKRTVLMQKLNNTCLVCKDGIHRKKAVCCIVGLCCMVLVSVLLLLFLSFLKYEAIIINDLNVTNPPSGARYILLDGDHSIPAFYFTTSSTASRKENVPIVLFLHNHNESVQMEDRSVFFQVLTSLGYNVIAPLHKLAREEVVSSWKWVKNQSNVAFLWGDLYNASVLISYGRLFCELALPPHGIMIEIDTQEKVEAWSCHCSTVGNVVSNYNNVHCPISFEGFYIEDVYSRIISCVQAFHE